MKNLLKYGFGAIGSALISFITIPFLTHIMTPSDFGKGGAYIMIISFLYYMANCGMDQVYERFYYEEKFEEKRSELFLTLIFISMFFFILTLIILFFISTPIGDYFFETRSTVVFPILAIGLLGFTLSKFCFISLRMQKKSGKYMIGQISQPLIYLLSILAFYFIFKKNSFYMILYGQLISYWFVFFLLFLLDIKTWGSIKRVTNLNLSDCYIFITYGWPFIFSYALAWGFQSIDRVLVIQLSGYNELGIYAAAFTLVAPLVLLQGVFSTIWSPIMNSIIIHNRFKAKYILSKTLHVMLTIMVCSAIAALCFAPVLHYLLGEEYSDAISVFGWLLFIPVFYVISDIAVAGIVLAKKSKLNMVTTMLSLLSNICACYLLIPTYGAIGAAISISISYLVLFITRWWLAKKYLHVKIEWFYLILVIICLVLAQMSGVYIKISLIFIVIALSFLWKIPNKSRLVLKFLG